MSYILIVTLLILTLAAIIYLIYDLILDGLALLLLVNEIYE
jgi:hypothetical protein